MIHWWNLLPLLGYFNFALAGSLLIPISYAVHDGGGGLQELALGFLITLATAVLLWLPGYRREAVELHHREGILLVVLAWVSITSLGAFPFFFSPFFPSYLDALFESVSGFTTTGATVLGNIEALPRSLLFWRSFTHWLGGMGIILLGIAVLPLIGSGGMELYRAEFSGARSEKLSPRVAETAAALWKIYALFSVLQYLALRLAGMGPFDAVCHTFSTMGTGGFSTRNISVESFQSPAIEWILIAFMILAGINFTRHYRLLVERRPGSFFQDREIQIYFLVLVLAVGAVSWERISSYTVAPAEAVRSATFQVVSIMTTTGFSSADFEQWAPFSQLMLLALMFVGGCTGSTAGGLKVARIVLLFLIVRRDFRRLVERRGVFAIRMESNRAVSEQTLQSVLNLIYLSFLVNFAASLILTALGSDIVTSISAVAAAMFNIGPGLGEVGPLDNYAHLPALAKGVLIFCMLAGRLEFYTLIVLLTTAFWRK